MSPDTSSDAVCPKCSQPVKTTNRFCESCGASLEPVTRCPACGAEMGPNAKFCGTCGSAAGAPPVLPDIPATPNPAGSPENERVLGVIANARIPKMFGLGGEIWTLVITDRRMILAKLTQQMTNNAIREAQAAAKAAGKGFFGQMVNQMAATGAFARRYLTMAPGEILAEVEGNRAIENRQITQVKVSVQESEDSQDTCKLLVRSGEGKSEFIIPEYEQASILLKQAYGDLAEVPGGTSQGFKLKLF